MQLRAGLYRLCLKLWKLFLSRHENNSLMLLLPYRLHSVTQKIARKIWKMHHSSSHIVAILWQNVYLKKKKTIESTLRSILKRPKQEMDIRTFSSHWICCEVVKSIIAKWKSMALLWIYLEQTVLKKLNDRARSLVWSFIVT